jgi:hypothetical protein
MKRLSVLLLLTLLTSYLARSADAADAQLTLIKAKAEETSTALVRGDYGKMADFTHPKLVEQVGGRAKMIAMIELGMKEMKAQGIEFKSATVDTPSPVVTEGALLLSVVPFTVKMSVPGGALSQKSFLIASSADGGKQWYFVDGSGVDEEKLKLMYGKVPAKLKLPEKVPPVVEKAK